MIENVPQFLILSHIFFLTPGKDGVKVVLTASRGSIDINYIIYWTNIDLILNVRYVQAIVV